MDPIAEKRFQLLKRRLDALHYSQPLSNIKIIKEK